MLRSRLRQRSHHRSPALARGFTQSASNDFGTSLANVTQLPNIKTAAYYLKPPSHPEKDLSFLKRGEKINPETGQGSNYLLNLSKWTVQEYSAAGIELASTSDAERLIPTQYSKSERDEILELTESNLARITPYFDWKPQTLPSSATGRIVPMVADANPTSTNLRNALTEAAAASLEVSVDRAFWDLLRLLFHPYPHLVTIKPQLTMAARVGLPLDGLPMSLVSKPDYVTTSKSGAIVHLSAEAKQKLVYLFHQVYGEAFIAAYLNKFSHGAPNRPIPVVTLRGSFIAAGYAWFPDEYLEGWKAGEIRAEHLPTCMAWSTFKKVKGSETPNYYVDLLDPVQRPTALRLLCRAKAMALVNTQPPQAPAAKTE